MQITTSTEHLHRICLAAPEEQPFLFTTREGNQVSAKVLTVHLTTLDDGTVRPIQTKFKAVGVAVGKDGRPGRARRVFEGKNLNRLPEDLRAAVLDAADQLGVHGLREDVAAFGPRRSATT